MGEMAPWLAASGAVLSAVVAALVGWYTVRSQRPKLKAETTEAITQAAQHVVEMYRIQHKECKEEVDDLRRELEDEREARKRQVERLSEAIEAGDRK